MARKYRGCLTSRLDRIEEKLDSLVLGAEELLRLRLNLVFLAEAIANAEKRVEAESDVMKKACQESFLLGLTAAQEFLNID